MRRLATTSLILLLACLGTWFCACERATPDLVAALPGVAPDVAGLLAEPQLPAFAALIETASTDRLLALRQPLVDAVLAPVDTSLAVDGLAGALAAIDQMLAVDRRLPAYRQETAFLAGLPVGEARRILAARRDAGAVFADAGLSVPTRIARIEEVLQYLEAAGDRHGTLGLYYHLAVLEHRRHDMPASDALQRRVYNRARALGRLPEACRAWGQLVMARLASGLSAADRDTLTMLTGEARRARLAAMSSYLICLHGYDEALRGRGASARSAYEDGIAISRELGEPAAALTTLVILLRMYAMLDCWDQVATLLEQAHGLLDEATAGREPSPAEHLTRTQLANLGARRLAALGRPEAAHTLFATTYATARLLPFAEVGFVAQQWVEAQMDAGRADLVADALTAIEPDLAVGDLPTLAARLPFWRAWLAWQHGRFDEAMASLDTFLATSSAEAWPLPSSLGDRAGALRARLQWRRDPAAATATLDHGWRLQQARLLRIDHTSETLLSLNRSPHLRWAAQDLLGQDPELGYGVELLWRDAMLRRSVVLEESGALVAGARARAVAARRRLADLRAVHCLYTLRPDAVLRWTATATAVTCDTLRIGPLELRERVAAALASLAEDPGDVDAPVPARLADALHTLARSLLPRSCLTADERPRRLLVTADGFLGQLPFAALNVGQPGAYEPLLAAVEVASVRHGSPAPHGRRGGEVLVVADPALDAATQRRFGLGAGLDGARREVADLGAALPSLTVLQGADATAARVRDRWQDAAVLYFVGHAITDPMVPFFAWLPLSPDDDATTLPGLGIRDVLAQRFDRCDAVFLSACATGAPFVDGPATAPSLGDAFLDAGAAAAVQTLWQVRDQQNPVRPERMLITWHRGQDDVTTAVADELRRAMHGPRGVRHPFSWAAWTVNVGAW